MPGPERGDTAAAHAEVDVLIPTYRRPAALAVTLAGLAAQTLPPARVVVSDQGEAPSSIDGPEVQAVARALAMRGTRVEFVRHPRRGLAEHRQSLLDRAAAPRALFLDDDVLLLPDALAVLVAALVREGCGFVGYGLIGATHLDDERPHQHGVEVWNGPVVPELVTPAAPAWQRHHLHSAANVVHVARRLGLTEDDAVLYRVAWIGGCVLYDVEALRAAGGFGFWSALPEDHAGEDVLAQLRVLARAGGAGVLPSRAHHLQLPTTVPDRPVDAPLALSV
ncbi:MAG TPA: glycosyltransferase family 2 protein, partial [Miltoncostaeaceae bacterium]|nr:glycosyltransferase family 2 protein [Miltoncostaeaceae bacterium]